jgi:hypothetical protein
VTLGKKRVVDEIIAHCGGNKKLKGVSSKLYTALVSPRSACNKGNADHIPLGSEQHAEYASAQACMAVARLQAHDDQPAQPDFEEKKSEQCSAVTTEPSADFKNELVFLLNDRQIQRLNGRKSRNILSNLAEIKAVSYYLLKGTITVDGHLLKLNSRRRYARGDRIRASREECVRQLERRLGLLFTHHEIAQIPNEFQFARELGGDRALLNQMMRVMSKGEQFIVHEANREEHHVLINHDRLYWKRQRQDRNDINCCLKLADIEDITLRMLFTKSTPNRKRHCRFTVSVSTKPSCKMPMLSLSTSKMARSTVRKFVAYLKCFQRHFSSRCPQTNYKPCKSIKYYD